MVLVEWIYKAVAYVPKLAAAGVAVSDALLSRGGWVSMSARRSDK